ncbi:hypothetical protein SEA_BANQUO_36 [Gordonia phage Banquo]|nr:hypothetical protein SEA_BANQUO_36 [Gordonia phage Banquo]
MMTIDEKQERLKRELAERRAEWNAGGRGVRLGMAQTVHVWGSGETLCGRKSRPGQQRQTLDPIQCKRCQKAAS